MSEINSYKYNKYKNKYYNLKYNQKGGAIFQDIHLHKIGNARSHMNSTWFKISPNGNFLIITEDKINHYPVNYNLININTNELITTIIGRIAFKGVAFSHNSMFVASIINYDIHDAPITDIHITNTLTGGIQLLPLPQILQQLQFGTRYITRDVIYSDDGVHLAVLYLITNHLLGHRISPIEEVYVIYKATYLN